MRNDCCYDVPLLESLQSLLKCEVVEKQVGIFGDYSYVIKLSLSTV